MRKIQIFIVAIFTVSKAFPAALYGNTLHKGIRRGIQNSDVISIKSLDGTPTESSATLSDTFRTSTVVTRRGLITSIASNVHQGIKRIVAPAKSLFVSATTEPAISSTATEPTVPDKSSASDKPTASENTEAKSASTTVRSIPDFDEGIFNTAPEFPDWGQLGQNVITASQTLASVGGPTNTVMSFFRHYFSVFFKLMLSFLKKATWFLLRNLPGFIVRTLSFIGFCEASSITCRVLTTMESTIQLILKLNESPSSRIVNTATQKMSEITRYAIDFIKKFG